MGNTGIITILLIIANVVFSLMAFNNRQLMSKYRFEIGPIIRDNDYLRFISSGFLHVNGGHLFINMFVLLMFGGSLEFVFGPILYLVLYFGALLGGNALAYFFHRKNPMYMAVGASGAISGIVMASVIFNPSQTFLLFFILPLPAWLFALLYVGYSIFGIQSQRDNIGHEAHLGGALVGIAVATLSIPLLFPPYVITIGDRLWLIALLTVPVVVFLWIFAKRPDLLNLKNTFNQFNNRSSGGSQSVDQRRQNHDRHHNPRKEMEKELDALLDKVGRVGMDGLTQKEKDRLNELSWFLGRNQ